jgi:hypothetical protein
VVREEVKSRLLTLRQHSVRWEDCATATALVRGGATVVGERLGRFSVGALVVGPRADRTVIYGWAMSHEDMADISDEDWNARLREALEKSQVIIRERMGLTADMLATEQRIDAMEADLDSITDPTQRERQREFLLQARLTHELGKTDNAQSALIGQLQEMVLALADRLRRLQIEVRELRGD